MFARRFSIPLPDRISMRWTIMGAGLLLIGQVASGTSALYAQLVFLFVVLSGLAVNLAGGLSGVGGFCIAVMSLKLVILSQITKTLMGEAGDSRLELPET